METRKKVISGLWIIILIAIMTGCQSSFVYAAEETDRESTVVVLEPDGMTVKNIITDADEYDVFCSDISNWQAVSSLPQEAEELYTYIYYEKVEDHSLLNNSGKFWLVSVQETLYRAGDTYYLKMGRISDGKEGIVLNMNACCKLPDSVGEQYMDLAEDNEDYLLSGSSAPSWVLENYEKGLEEYFEAREDAVEDYFDSYEDRIEDEMDAFDQYFEEETIPWIEEHFDKDWDLVIEDRIDRWLDRSFERMGGIIEVGVGVLVRFIISIIFLPFIVLYILGAVGLYRMARKLGYGSPWLAWIPIANLYLMFILPGKPFRVLALNKVIEKRENAFWIFVAVAIAKRVLEGILEFPGGRLFFLADDAVGIVWLVFLIFFLYPLYKHLFSLFVTEHRAVVFSVLSLILPFLLPIFLLAASSKTPRDAGDVLSAQTTEGKSVSVTV